MRGLEDYYREGDGFNWDDGQGFGVGDVVALRLDSSVEHSDELSSSHHYASLEARAAERQYAGSTLTAYRNGERVGMMAIRVYCGSRWAVQLGTAGDAVRITEGCFTGLSTASEAEADTAEIQSLVEGHVESEQMEAETQFEEEQERRQQERWEERSDDDY